MKWKREERRERGEADCKFTTGFDTKIKKTCERDMWVMH
jgi:hypothetical protein